MTEDTPPDSTPDIRGWLSQQEAARAYGVTARTIRRRIARGEVRAVPVVSEHGPGWAVEPPPDYAHGGPGAGAGAPGDVLPVSLDAAGLLALLQQQAATIAQLTNTNAVLVEQIRTLQDRAALAAGAPVEAPPPALALAPGPRADKQRENNAPTRPWWQFWRR